MKFKKPKAYAMVIDPKQKNWGLSVWIAFTMLILPFPVLAWRRLVCPMLLLIADFFFYFIHWGYYGLSGRLGRTAIDPKILELKKEIEKRLNKPDV